MFLNNNNSQNEFHNLNHEPQVQAGPHIAHAGLYDSEIVTSPNQTKSQDIVMQTFLSMVILLFISVIWGINPNAAHAEGNVSQFDITDVITKRRWNH